MDRHPAVIVYLVCFLLACQARVSTAAPDIAPGLEQIQPLAKGDKAPAFTVYREDGTPFRFEPDRLDTTTLIVFYRGGWCGACNEQLRDLAGVVPDIRQMGADILFINGDRPEILYTSLKPETSQAIKGLGYTLLSDAGLNAAGAFGVAYVLADDVLQRYTSREEWDLADSSIDRYNALPLPSIFIIDAGGSIAFDFYNMDPAVRLPAEGVKAAVEEAMTSHPPPR